MIKISGHYPLQDPIFLCFQHCHTLPTADEMIFSGGRITVKTQVSVFSQEKWGILVKTIPLLLRAETPMVLLGFQ